MAEERDYELDPLAVEQSAQLINEFGNELKRQQATAEAKQVEDANEEQALAEQDDPRNAEKWGIRAVAKELQSAATGGAQDTLSSVTTFPERTIDALSGEMAKEREEKVTMHLTGNHSIAMKILSLPKHGGVSLHVVQYTSVQWL